MTRRVCAELGCGAFLHRYNRDDRCWVHQQRVDTVKRARERAAGDALADVVGERAREVAALILAAPTPLTTREIADAVGLTPQGAGIHLRALVAAGAVERQRVGRRGRGFDMTYAPARPNSELLAA